MLQQRRTDGDIIAIRRKGANSVVVGRNGKTIAGLAEDLTIDADKREIDLNYNGTTSDWEVEARVRMSSLSGLFSSGGGNSREKTFITSPHPALGPYLTTWTLLFMLLVGLDRVAC